MEEFEDPLKLAMLAITEDRLDRAIEYADEVLEHEENVEAMLIKAEALMRLNRVAESDRIVDRILEKQPNNIEAIKNKAMNCFMSFNFREALYWADEGMKIDSEDFDVLISKANIMYLLGDDYFCEYVERARKVDRERTENFMENFWIWNEEGYIAKMADNIMDEAVYGSVDKALNMVDEAIELSVDKPDIDFLSYMKATLLVGVGREEEAMELVGEEEFDEILDSARKAKDSNIEELMDLDEAPTIKPFDDHISHLEVVEKERIGIYELKKINKDLRKTLKKMPVEWVNGIAENLEVKERYKKDRVEKIVNALNSRCEEIVKDLPHASRQALQFVMDRGGVVRYSELRRNFNCNINFYWNKRRPGSPVGILRSYGLLVVGVKKLDKHCKVAEVPEELRDKVERALQQ